MIRFWSYSYVSTKDNEFLSSLPPEFKQAFKKRFGCLDAATIRMNYCSSAKNTQKIIQFPFPHKWMEIIMEETRWQRKLLEFYMSVPALRRFKQLMVQWFRTRVLKTGDIIIRDRKNKKPDIRMTILYHPIRDEYFNAAFSGLFKRDMEEGAFVIHTRKEGTSQEAVQLYWGRYRYKQDGEQNVFAFLDNHKNTLEELKEGFQSILVIADKWNDERFGEMISEYLMKYMNNTIYNRNNTSMKRMEDFVNNDPVLVEYIWTSNFHTEKSRFALAYELKISKRDEKGFIKSQTIADLKQYISRKKSMNKNVYDKLPDHIWREIKKTEEDYATAKSGVPVGRYGRYYSSEEIDAAYQRHKEAWIKADRWIGKQNSHNTIRMNC